MDPSDVSADAGPGGAGAGAGPPVAESIERPGATGEADRELVAVMLGREPMGAFEVAVRDPQGRPSVIRNNPVLDDGTPMPTLYWLVDPELRRRVAQLESLGGVRRAEEEVDAAALTEAHTRYAAERDASVPAGHTGPRASGGVGGTRRGVKCLHAHYAWFLAGGDDPVGRWVDRELRVQAL